MSASLALAALPTGRTRLAGTLAVPLLALPSLFFLALAFVVPLVVVLSFAFWGEAGMTLTHFFDFFRNPLHSWAVLRTLVFALATGALAILLGFPLGYMMARSSPRMQTLLMIATFLPLSTSVIVKSFAITVALKSNGFVNATLIQLGIIDAPMRLIFTEAALIFGALNVFLPFAVLPVYAVLVARGENLEAAAASLGCGPWFTLFHVTLPNAMPGIIAGFSIVVAQAISAYVVPTLLIGDRFRVLSRIVYDSYVMDLPERAAVASLVLLVLAVVVNGFASKFGLRRVAESAGKPA